MNILKAPEHLSELSLPQQNYVEAIAALTLRNGQVRMTDLADFLHVRMPSASEAVKRLQALGLIARPSRSSLTLTARGREWAAQLDARENVLRRFMVEVLGMPEADAREMACKVEHCVSRDFADRLWRLAQYLEATDRVDLAQIRQKLRGGQKSAE